MRALSTLLWTTAFFCASFGDNWAADHEVKFNLLALPGSRLAGNVLTSPAQIEYQHAPLRACVAQLAERYRFSYWIDRRVDADRPLNVQVKDGDVRECLTRLAVLCDAEVGLVENVVTIARADRLAAMQYAAVRLHDQISQGQLGSDRSNVLNNATLRPLNWPILATPTQVAGLISSAWEIPLKASLPHDLMNAGNLQPCTLATQLTLLFGGFDQCVAGPRTTDLRVVTMPPAAAWQATYSANSVDQRNASALASEFPTAKLTNSGSQWTLVGSTAAHLRLLKPLSTTGRSVPHATSPRQPAMTPRQQTGEGRQRPKPMPDPLAEQRYTISKVNQQPIRSVLTALANQLGLDLQWDPALTQADMLRPVSLDAKNAKIDDILQRLSAQSKLVIVRQDSRVTIGPAPTP